MVRSTDQQIKTASGPRLVFGYLGLFLVFIGIITAIPLVILAFYPNEADAWFAFAVPAGADVLLGSVLYLILLKGRKPTRFLRYQDAMLLTLIWIAAILSGAMPFFIAHLTGHSSMTFSSSFFESASAYTSTGLTAFDGFLDSGSDFAVHVFCFHRSWMQFIGGIGLILVLSSILGGQNGTALYISEGHNDKLLPNLSKSARLIFGIYSGYTLVGAVALFFAGLDPFDAICHSMCALAGGGMSTRSANIAAFRAFEGTATLNGIIPCNSLAVEIIIDVLVCLSAISFVLHVFLLTGKFKKFLRDDETRYMIFVGFGAIIAAFFSVLGYAYQAGAGGFFDNSGAALRDSSFYVVGSFTTSGFANTSIERLKELGKPLIFICTLLMVIGGGSGSTAGGLKIYRLIIVMKQMRFSIVHRFESPHKRSPFLSYRYGKINEVTDGQVIESFTYMAMYLLVYFAAIIIVCFLPGFGVENACFDVASAIANVGTSLDDFVLYSAENPQAWIALSWTLSIVMILGRLEIIPIFNSIRNVRDEAIYYKKKRQAERELLEM